MDTLVQIQAIKSQLDIMKLQINNIEIQYNQMMNPMMNNSIGEQLLNLGIQLLNSGINAFKIGKPICMNYFNYSGELNIIAEKINLIINENNMQQQFMINQQNMMPNQMMPFSNFGQPNMMKIEKKSIIFKDIFNNIITIRAFFGTTIGELLKLYMDKRKNNNLDDKEERLIFLYNGSALDRNDKRKIENVFNLSDHTTIIVNIIK